MKSFKFLIISFLFISSSIAQRLPVKWLKFDDGIYYSVINGPRQSKIADSKISVIKIIPSFYNFDLIIASQTDSVFKTLPEWCAEKKLLFAVNAGMYSLANRYKATGFMRNKAHINNPIFKGGFNALLAFNPTKTGIPIFRIIDLENEKFEDFENEYQCFIQSIRLISNKSEAVYWSPKNRLKCSMTFLAIDKDNNVLVFFTRSPYSPNEMIDFMLHKPLQVKTAMYLEGGPEASFYINTQDTAFGKFGSYVSKSYPTDKNTEFKKMPNVIGVRKKNK